MRDHFSFEPVSEKPKGEIKIIRAKTILRRYLWRIVVP